MEGRRIVVSNTFIVNVNINLELFIVKRQWGRDRFALKDDPSKNDRISARSHNNS